MILEIYFLASWAVVFYIMFNGGLETKRRKTTWLCEEQNITQNCKVTNQNPTEVQRGQRGKKNISWMDFHFLQRINIRSPSNFKNIT